MGQPAAKQNDQITGTDNHAVETSTSPVSLPFNGVINGGLSTDVNIQGKPAAVVGSTANDPSHTPPAVPFVTPPTNQASIQAGSATVNINGMPAPRHGDQPRPAARGPSRPEPSWWCPAP
jgi:uncharacterized Zn-binding protein involved in type VI secretion